MAGSKSDALENLTLDLYLGAVSAGWTRPAAFNSLELALYTSSPGDATGGTECTGGGYARKALTNDGTLFGAASGGSKSNLVEIAFTTFTGSVSAGANIVGWVLFNSAGTRLYWGDLQAADQKPYTTNDQFVLPVGQLVITED